MKKKPKAEAALPSEGTDGMKRENEHHTSTSHITARVRASISRRTYVAHISKASIDDALTLECISRRTYIKGAHISKAET